MALKSTIIGKRQQQQQRRNQTKQEMPNWTQGLTPVAAPKARNSDQSPSGVQAGMPSRQARSEARKRPEERPEVISSDEKIPSWAELRATWICMTLRSPDDDGSQAQDIQIQSARLPKKGGGLEKW